MQTGTGHRGKEEGSPGSTPIAQPTLIHDHPGLSQVDIIGDLHGCYDELCRLLDRLGHSDLSGRGESIGEGTGPRVIFVGDLTDRGDRNVDTFNLVADLVERGDALCVIGNHDRRLMRWLRGEDVAVAHGLGATIAEFEHLPPAEQSRFRDRAIHFFETIPSAVRFDQGRAVVVHAAWRSGMAAEENPKRIYYYAMYGPTTGRKTPEGFPDRIDWASGYRGPEHVIFGHQVYKVPYVNPFATGIDTGCVFGGRLTALRWPRRELVTVDSAYARAEYGRRLEG
jgi:protein phosphatase